MSQFSGGNVGARVSAFQSPRKMYAQSPTQTKFGIISDRERSNDSDFGSPVGRSSRDDIEGVTGEGKASISSAKFTMAPSVKEGNEYSVRLWRPNLRPATSFGWWNADGAADLRKNLRPRRSLENIVSKSDTPNELLVARSRLKPVGMTRKTSSGHASQDCEGHTSAPIRRYKTNSSVLDELDDLLDDAIDEQEAKLIIADSHENSKKPPPTPSMTRGQSFPSSGITRRWHARLQRVRESGPERLEAETSRRKSRQSIDASGPRSSSDTDRAEHQGKASSADVGHKPPGMERSLKPQDDQSPVKHRAALFEQLSQREVSHALGPLPQICGRKAWPGKVASMTENAGQVTFLQSLQHHHQKFHHDMDEAISRHHSDPPLRSSLPGTSKSTPVPPIPLALPQLMSPRLRSKAPLASSQNSYTRAPQSEHISINTPVVIAGNTQEQSPPGRGTSLNWPFKWELSKKSPVPAKHSGIAARALPDHHASAKKTHEAQHRVHDLLVAAHEGAKVPEHEAAEEQKEYISSPEYVQYDEFDHKDAARPRSRSPPINPMPGMLLETPKGSSSDEKEIANSPVRSKHGTQLRASKVEKLARSATPSSPVRGRRKVQDFQEVASSVEAKENAVYAVEQRFALSRSRSRGGGIRVQVEIRSPKSSPERNGDGGDHVVIVTANVEPNKREDDGAD